MRVPWLTRSEIGKQAERVTAGYEALTGRPVEPPVPVEDMIERYLGLTLSFEDLDRALGMEGVLGATYVGKRLVCINDRLLDEGPEGRVVFTCAHEAGHWVLHRRLVQEEVRRVGGRQAIVCRTGSARDPLEWQADYFASCLLMPVPNIRDAFHRAFGCDCLPIRNVRSALGGTSLFVDPCVQNWHFLASAVIQAGGFSNVSKHAMILRLEDLGLLQNLTDTPLGWVERAR